MDERCSLRCFQSPSELLGDGELHERNPWNHSINLYVHLFDLFRYLAAAIIFHDRVILRKYQAVLLAGFQKNDRQFHK